MNNTYDKEIYRPVWEDLISDPKKIRIENKNEETDEWDDQPQDLISFI